MARISLDFDRILGRVDPRIFGAFVEHEGRCVYGGIVEEGSPVADKAGYRTDVRRAIEDLQVPVLRWPGGNFVSAYHWQDGIGPKDSRPQRFDPAWGAVESNRFGTDEFMTYCELLGAEPYVCLNMGTGTLEEAMAWVEYCNGDLDTYWANRRRHNGRQEPYAVRYWGLGNELWGEFQVGHLSVERYVEKAKQWALALRRVDPTIQLVACGHNGWSDWDRMVIDELVPYVDFHSVHIYTGSDDYWSNVLLPHQVDRALRASRAMIDRARYVADVRHPVHVVYDEWNVWFPTREDRRRDKIVAERHTLSDALAVATYLNIFVRHCDTLRMANLAQLVNVLAPIVTDDTRVLLQAIYHPLRLAATYTLEFALDVAVDCDRIEHADTPDANRMTHRIADLGPFDVLDVAATSDASRSRVVLNIVNRRPDAPVEATIDLRGAQVRGEMTARVITADSPLTTNSFDRPEAVSVSERKVNVTGSCIPYEFPACSVTQLAFEVGE